MNLRFIAAALCAFALLGLAQLQPPSGQTDTLWTDPIDKTAADYTDEARLAGLEGSVRVESTIGEDGHPRDLQIVETLGLGLDERALEAVSQELYEPTSSGRRASTTVHYHLSSKVSRWHLIHADFHPPEGASRPQFLRVNYPSGARIRSGAAISEGRLLGAMGREGTAAISFVVDEQGAVGRFKIVNASENVWGQEAIVLVSQWRFKPGAKDNKPVAVPATLELAWGPRELDPERISRLRVALDFTGWAPVKPEARQATFSPPIPSPPGIEILNQVQPTYSQEARDAHLEGAVLVSLVTQENGKPTNLRIVEGLGKGLDESALEAVSQWRFKPLYLNGVFSPSEITLRIYFKLK